MRFSLHTLVGIAVAVPLVLLGRTLGAQSSPPEQISPESRRLLESGYLAPRDQAQLLECTYTALTRKMSLDESQSAVVKRSIEQQYDTAGVRKPPSKKEWTRRTATRDSTILAVLRTKADSSRFRANAGSEIWWFQSGACNGKLQVP